MTPRYASLIAEKAAAASEVQRWSLFLGSKFPLSQGRNPACLHSHRCYLFQPFMKADIHPKYVEAEIRCACGNVIKTRSTKPVIIVGICNVCHPFYTGQQKFVDTAGRVDKFQQRMAKTQAAQAAAAAPKKKKA